MSSGWASRTTHDDANAQDVRKALGAEWTMRRSRYSCGAGCDPTMLRSNRMRLLTVEAGDRHSWDAHINMSARPARSEPLGRQYSA